MFFIICDVCELDSFLEMKLRQSRTKATNCFLFLIFRNAIPRNDSFLLLSLFLSAGDKRKREEKRKKEESIVAIVPLGMD